MWKTSSRVRRCNECRKQMDSNWKEKILPSPSVTCINMSLLPSSLSHLSLPSSLGVPPQEPTAFLLDRCCLGKQATAAVCARVRAAVCVCVRPCCPFVVVSPHMLALTCWRPRIRSYKPLLKLDLFTLLLARGDNKNSMTRPSLGPPPGREKSHGELGQAGGEIE